MSEPQKKSINNIISDNNMKMMVFKL